MENESIKTLLTRRSVRKYKPEHITEEEMEIILEAGKYAPTGKGTQCTKFVVVRNKAVRDKLSEINAEILGANSDPFYGAPDVIAEQRGDRNLDRGRLSRDGQPDERRPRHRPRLLLDQPGAADVRQPGGKSHGDRLGHSREL